MFSTHTRYINDVVISSITLYGLAASKNDSVGWEGRRGGWGGEEGGVGGECY